MRWLFYAVTVAAGLILLTSCGSSSSAFNPTPAISGLFPDSATANDMSGTACTSGSPVPVNIAGTGFIANSQALWNGTNRTTTFNPNTNQLVVMLLACDLTTQGIAQVTVSNPAPGGGTSAAATFTINAANNPLPVISSISPTSTAVGALPPGGVITINASDASSGFVPDSIVAFNGAQRPMTFVSSTQLTAQVETSDVAANASINVTVDNPTPGGGVSAPVVFTVGTGAAARIFPAVVSVSALGGGANGPSAAPAMSSDGRYVGFFSQARNLVANGPSGNIFVRDTCRGAGNCSPQTTAVDLAADGSAPNASAGEHISLSADGRYVAFVSSASNLTATASFAAGESGMPPDSHVFVRDLCVGASAARDCTPRTTMVSVDANANPAHALSPSISGDGRFVAYVSWDRDPSASGSAGTPQIFVRDTCAGAAAACTPHTYRLPADSTGGWVGDAKPAISSDGRFVTFERWTRDAAASAGALRSRILMRDTCLGADAPGGCLPSTMTISISPDGGALAGASMFPSISSDGRFVGFVSQSPEGESGSGASAEKLYLRDTCQGASATENCVPSSALIGEGVASIPGYASAFSPWVSPSGRFITFVAGAAEQSHTNEAPRDGVLFVHDSCFGAAKGCAPRTYSVAAPSSDGGSRPALSVYKFTQIPLTADGAVAAFYSPFAVPAAPSSGMGDVYITVTNF